MGRACSTCGGEDRCILGFGGEVRGERNRLEDLFVNGMSVRMVLKETVCGDMDGIDLA